MAIIKLSGNAETDSGRFAMPVDGAVGIYFTNNSESKLTNNFAIGELLAEIKGSLSPTIDYTSMKYSTGYVQTDIAETSDMTVFAIYEQPNSITTSGAMIASTYKGDATSFGMALYANDSKINFLATQKNTSGANTAGGQFVAASGWQLVMGRVGGATNTVKNITTNESKSGTYSSRVLGNDPQKIRVGGSYDGAFNDTVKVMAVVVFNRALSDDDAVKIADVLKRYAAKHGVTV